MTGQLVVSRIAIQWRCTDRLLIGRTGQMPERPGHTGCWTTQKRWSNDVIKTMTIKRGKNNYLVIVVFFSSPKHFTLTLFNTGTVFPVTLWLLRTYMSSFLLPVCRRKYIYIHIKFIKILRTVLFLPEPLTPHDRTRVYTVVGKKEIVHLWWLHIVQDH